MYLLIAEERFSFKVAFNKICMQKNEANSAGRGIVAGALGVAVAAALGAAAGMLFAPQSGAKTREELGKKAEELATTFKQSKDEIHAWLTEVFGTVTDTLEEAYLTIRGNILAAVDAVEDKAKFSQKAYEKIVDDVLKEAGKDKEWAEEKVAALAKRFKGEWKKIQATLK